MPDYQITRVSDDVKEWKGPKGTIYYHKVLLDGWEKPVSIGKKKAHALSPGDTISGTIERTDAPEDKWHAAPMGSFGGGGGFGGNAQPAKYAPKDDHTQESIARSVALKASVDMGSKTTEEAIHNAEKFLAWLQGSSESTSPKAMTSEQSQSGRSEKMNSATATQTSSGYDKFKAQGQAMRRDERDEYNDMRNEQEPLPDFPGE